MRHFAAALSITALIAATPALAKRPMVPADLAKIADVSDPQIDAAGDWIAYKVRTVDVEADKSETHLWMARWDGKQSVQITGRKGESESGQRFSPDGRSLAFISGRGDDEEDDQLWIMNRAGGEAIKMPGIKGSVDDIAWAPDSKSLALIITDPDPKDEAEAKAAKPGEKRPKPIVIDRFQFKADKIGYLSAKRDRLWLYDLTSKTARRATTGDFAEVLPSWSPDGSTIAFTSNREADPDRSYNSNLFVVTIGKAPAEPKVLTSFKGFDNDETWGSYPAWSPEGKTIAYLQGGPVELFSYGVRTLAIVPSAGGAPRILTGGLDRNVTNPLWSADGKTILFRVEDDGIVRIAQIAAKGGTVTPVAEGFRVFSGLTQSKAGRRAVLISTPAAPPELYALDGAVPRQISHHNDALLADLDLGIVTTTRFKSKDGTDVHGFQTLPPGATGKIALPTMLNNHGGPQNQFDAGFAPIWQIMAGAGYAVVASNPRGGTGRGEAYAKALYADWGGVAVPDALAAVDDAVARGIADPNRLVVGGWSYGGMLTNYLIASDTRFKAATSGASIANVLAGYGTDEYIRDYEAELGKPWDKPDVWLRNSYPFYQNQKIITPTLFMAGDKDFNVPLWHSEQMYQALKSRNIKTQLVIYPGQFHGLTRPSFIKDRIERWIKWYADALK